MSSGCSNACKLSPMDSISKIGAIGYHMMNSVGVRYVDARSNDLLVNMTDAAPICVGNLLLDRYFKGQMRKGFLFVDNQLLQTLELLL